MKSVEVFGQTIKYYDVGTGPTVVLLHGLASSAARDWGSCITLLSAHHRVLAPDQLGFGDSAKPAIDYGIQTWVDFLGEFLRVEKVKEFALAGESLGGWVAAQYAIQSLGPRGTSMPAYPLSAPRFLILVDAAGHRKLAEAIVAGGHNGLSLGRLEGSPLGGLLRHLSQDGRGRAGELRSGHGEGRRLDDPLAHLQPRDHRREHRRPARADHDSDTGGVGRRGQARPP